MMNILKKISNILMKLFSKIEIYYVNHSIEKKRIYLIKQGCVIGKKTRILCNIDSFGTEPYLIEIGDDCLISDSVRFHPHDGGVKVLNDAGYFDGKRMDKMGRIKIGNNCFIGSEAKIMMNVTIGDNVIIGGGSIVSKNIPSNCVVAGIPARVICSLDDYYEKNNKRGVFYETGSLSQSEKKKYLSLHVTKL